MKLQYSDEMINAYVDGELTGADREAFRQAMEADASLREEARSICELKKQLKQSYGQVPVPGQSEARNSRRVMTCVRYGAAAMLAIVVGTVAGWMGHSKYETMQEVADVGSLNGLQLSPVDLSQPNKIVLHIGSAEPAKLKRTLDQVEYVIRHYRDTDVPFQIEVVANSGGIDLMRRGVSPYEKKIQHLMRTYNNVSFVACNNAVERLRVQGVDAEMIAEVKTGMSAVERIVQRLREGWVYVKV
ncbi:MAG TPA: hypothetical protein VIQ03_04800 [Gammaproteobacteria bacterium]